MFNISLHQSMQCDAELFELSQTDDAGSEATFQSAVSVGLACRAVLMLAAIKEQGMRHQYP